MVASAKASLAGIKKEVTAGSYLAPTVGAEILPIRPGFEIAYEPEPLESDELLNDIGAAKSAVGKSSVPGSFPAYLRHSGVEGQEPQRGIFFESLFGSKFIATIDQVTVAASTTSVLKFGGGVGAQLRVGQALLIKDGTNGYSIRNIASISGNDVTLNFQLSVAPGSGIGTGKAICYIPAATGHPNFSITRYLGNGDGIEAGAGCTTTEYSLSAGAGGYGEEEFGFEGVKYLFNPLKIGPTNKYIDLTDDTGTIAVAIPEAIYSTPIELADAIHAALNAASTEDYTFTYSNITGKFTLSSTSTVLSLLWFTGANAANSIGTTIGFLVAANDTGSLTYTSDNAQTYAAPVTPAYDAGDKIVIKNAQLFIGTLTDNVCLCAQEVGITISKETEDVDCICEESGVSEKIAVSRTAEMTVTMSLKKYDASLLDALLKNSTISAMLNTGKKNGGNWVPGQCANFYLQSCTVGTYKTKGDSFVQVELSLKGFVSATTKDVYHNYV